MKVRIIKTGYDTWRPQYKGWFTWYDFKETVAKLGSYYYEPLAEVSVERHSYSEALEYLQKLARKTHRNPVYYGPIDLKILKDS